MTPSPDALHAHADVVAAEQLRRRRALLTRLDRARRREIERAARDVAAALAECLLEEARKDSAVAEALESVYAEPAQAEVRYSSPIGEQFRAARP